MNNLEYNQKRFAVLIDADNIKKTIIPGVLEETANFGVASVKRVYGDWSNPNTKLEDWKNIALEYSIQPIQQYAYTKGKNATDIALVIDAMDLLYSGNLDGFCIVSSDSDFTRLSEKLRESGKTVFGFGEKKTPEPFIQACDRFFYSENLNSAQNTENTVPDPSQSKKWSPSDLKQDTRLIQSVRKAIENSEDDEGWADLGLIGQSIQKNFRQFDVRTYGYRKLKDLLKAINLFEVDTQKSDGKNGRIVKTFVKDLKDKKRK